jgi:NADP-dependent 3-hydroxy acid dehydrogenase YdfG
VFARAGAKVLMVARDSGQVEAAAAEIAAMGGVATPFTTDVTNADQMREAARWWRATTSSSRRRQNLAVQTRCFGP